MMIYNKDEKTGELYHYGIKGQRWGVRRYQNEDGTYTAEGAARRRIGDDNPQINKNIIRGNERHSADAPKDLCDKANKVNGGKIGYTKGYNRSMNCCFCSIAYEQISRGKQVRAKASTLGGYDNNLMKNVFNYKDSEYKKFATDKKSKIHGTSKEDYESLCSDIEKDGKNTRGTIQVTWKGANGGHIFNYETKDGKIYFVDGQIAKVMNKKDAYDTFFKNAYDIRKFRTDNKKMNKKADLFVESNKNELNVGKFKQRSEPKSTTQLTMESIPASLALLTVSEVLNTIVPGLGILATTAPRAINYATHTNERRDAKKLVEEQKALKINEILGEPEAKKSIFDKIKKE